jgi:hypothetical protein
MAGDGSRAEYFREKAREVRKKAENAWDPALRGEYEILVQLYERLAALNDTG